MKRQVKRQNSNSTNSGVVFTTVSLRAIGEIGTGVDRMGLMQNEMTREWEQGPQVATNQTSSVPVVMTPATPVVERSLPGSRRDAHSNLVDLGLQRG